MLKYILGFIRLFSFGWIVGGYLVILSVMLFFIKPLHREHFILKYRGLMARTLFIFLGLRVHKSGNSPVGPCLLVSNHRSYVDPAPVTAFTPALPVAKMEIKTWPLIGIGVKMTGILLVDRSSAQSRIEAVLSMKEAWDKGKVVLNYPEGTTHDHDYTLPFKKGAFKAAFEYEVPIIPVCIDYGHKSDAWVGDDTFIPHFIRCFGKWRTEAFIEFGEPMVGDSIDEVMTEAKSWMDLRLKRLASERKK